MKSLKIRGGGGEPCTVYELIERLKDDALRGECAGLMRVMRTLLSDIKKNRSDYPLGIETLRAFVLFQLRSNLARLPASRVSGIRELRRLAEDAVLTVVMQEIYMSDCLEARKAANLRLDKLRGLHEQD